MIYFKQSLFFGVFILISGHIFSQTGIGQWRDHFSYSNVQTIVKAENQFICGTELATFAYDTEYGNTDKYSKITDFSDYNVQKVAYCKPTKTVIIAYKNSNIDILQNNTIYNFADIKRKQINGDKNIYNITFIGNKALIACGFGIVVFNTERLEFTDTWIIGENATEMPVYDIAVDNNYIYAGTENGIFQALITTTNLADYRNWKIDNTLPLSDYKVNALTFVGNVLYANTVYKANNQSMIYKQVDANWAKFDTRQHWISSITSGNSKVVITDLNSVKIYDTNNINLYQIDKYIFTDTTYAAYPNSAILENNTLYIADKNHGLVEYNLSTDKAEFIFPEGPRKNYAGRATFAGQKFFLTAGTPSNDTWIDGEYFIFEKNKWQSVQLGRPEVNDFYSILIDPKDDNHVFVGSWAKGIFEFQNNELSNEFNATNSSLQIQKGYIMPSGMAYDNQGNIWVANYRVGEPISVKTPDGVWKSFSFNGKISNVATGDIINTQNGNMWVQLAKADGLFVFNDNNTPLDATDDQYKRFYPLSSSGEDYSRGALSIAEDKNGEIWVGLDEGIVVYHNPETVFDDSPFFADKIQLTAFGKDTTIQYLLGTEAITSIEVDGANRKWLGTQNSGVFLVAENGKEELLSFNTINSPLPSNSILDIAINEVTGEVFFITDKGTVAYRGDATKGESQFGNVYVFPNPVRPGYNGKIAVTGLADDVNVKFTDISGNLVFETQALGGQAIWDGKNFSGDKVHTGVYLVFCSNNDGSETFVTKLLFMN